MTVVFSTYITIARPMRDGDLGRVEEGNYTVANDVVTLTDQDGKPIMTGRMQTSYSAKMAEGETAADVAKRLLWRKYRATKGASDFNRPLDYPDLGIV